MIEKSIIEKVKKVDLKHFLENQGYTFVKEDHVSYRCMQDRTLLITYKYDNPIYFWIRKGQKGDIISYVRNNIIRGSFNKAIEFLLNFNDKFSIECAAESYEKGECADNTVVEMNYSTDLKRTYAYLCKTRKIDISIVNEFVNKGLIRQDTWNNVIFKYLNETGEIVGGELSGTNTYKKFKGIIKNSNSDYAFSYEIGKVMKSLYVFEATIDLISFYEINKGKLKNTLLLSISGCEKINVIETYLDYHDYINTLYLCLDNDEPGDVATKNIKSKYNKFTIIDYREELIKNKVKDFNELLKLQKR